MHCSLKSHILVIPPFSKRLHINEFHTICELVVHSTLRALGLRLALLKLGVSISSQFILLPHKKAVSILRPFCALQQYKVPSTRGSVSDVLASAIGRRLSLTKELFSFRKL